MARWALMQISWRGLQFCSITRTEAKVLFPGQLDQVSYKVTVQKLTIVGRRTSARALAILDDPLVPLHLLIWAATTAISTLTATVEVLASQGLMRGEKVALAQLYLPYLCLGGFFFPSESVARCGEGLISFLKC